MGKEITLLPEQLKNIEQKLEEIEQQRRELIEVYRGNINGVHYDPSGFADVPNSGYAHEMSVLEEQKKNLENILKAAEVIKLYSDKTIEIGTRFTATLNYNGEIEANEYILASTRVGTGSKLNKGEKEVIYVTPDSLFGKAVLGKRVGDPISYKAGDTDVIGFVEQIAPLAKEPQIQKTQKI